MLDSSLILAALGASGRTRQARPWATPPKRHNAKRPSTSAVLSSSKGSGRMTPETEQVLTETTPRK